MMKERMYELAQRVVDETLHDLRETEGIVVTIPVILADVPDEVMADEIGEDCLGLFCGPALDEPPESAEGEVPRVFLYLQNIWDYAEKDEDWFCEEVEVTLLHELGHYLGWEEDDLEERGLD